MKEKLSEIRKQFIEWDNEGHSNASQKEILNFFENKFNDIYDFGYRKGYLDACIDATNDTIE